MSDTEIPGDVPADFEAGQDVSPELGTKLDEGIRQIDNGEVVRTERREYPYREGTQYHHAPGVMYDSSTDSYTVNGETFPNLVKNPAVPHPPLKNYKVGETVEVLRGGDWLQGVISSIQAGSVNVDTERGPVPVGGPLRIRKVG